MGAKNTTNKGITYLKLKAKTSETDLTPVFAKQEKKDGSYVITETFNSVDGYLKEITSETYEYEGETKHKCKMKFQDKSGETTYVESNFNNLLYGILNSLAGQPCGFIDIQIWLGKERDNGKRYPSAGVQNNGKKAEWKFKVEELPRPKEIKAGKKTVYDDENVIEFWNKVIGQIQLEDSDYVPQEEVADAPPVDGSDLPF